MNHVIGDHVDESVLIAQGMESDAPRVGVLVDETLALAIHQDASCKAVRWAERQPRTRSYSTLIVSRAGPDAHADPAAVVVRGADPPCRFRHVG